VIVVSQTLEVVEGNHLQVWPGESVRQLLADGFEDADSREFSRRAPQVLPSCVGLVPAASAGSVSRGCEPRIFRSDRVENAASTLAVNENSGFRIGALPFCFRFPVLPFEKHVFGMAVSLPRGSL